MEGVNELPTMGPSSVGPAKRKNLMGNIKSRVNSGDYNVRQYFKKNRKNLEEKVKFFQKKEVAGELKPYMIPRYDAARELLERLDALNPGGGPTVMSMAPSVPSAPVAPVVPMSPSAPVVPLEPVIPFKPPTVKMTLKKRTTTKKPTLALPTVPYAPEFNPPFPSTAPKGVPYGEYSPGGNFKIQGVREPVIETPRNVFNNVSKLRIRSPGTRRKTNTLKTKTIKVNTPHNSYNEYYLSAQKFFLPLPELYDPFTGRKFSPDEDPLADIERADEILNDLYNPFTGNKFGPHDNPKAKLNKARSMLLGILKKAHRKAATMRKARR
uniref:Uncharacterized protein n=1 Tax=viral metagenome TaxID=1070528 RepID=A0A6C0K4U5_9ZZZZ